MCFGQTSQAQHLTYLDQILGKDRLLHLFKYAFPNLHYSYSTVSVRSVFSPLLTKQFFDEH